MAKQNDITAERLRELLNYDPHTGVFTWRVRKGKRAEAGAVAGNQNDRGYWRIGIDDRRYFVHRLAWLWMTGTWPTMEIDHVNRDKADNRWCNLREASRSQNSFNRGLYRCNTSGHKGVTWSKQAKKWQAQLFINGRRIHLGQYQNIDKAAAAYAIASAHYHGEFGDEQMKNLR